MSKISITLLVENHIFLTFAGFGPDLVFGKS